MARRWPGGSIVLVAAISAWMLLALPGPSAHAGQATSPRSSPGTSRPGAELPLGFSEAPKLPTEFVPRWNFAYAYFPPNDQVVLFGGAPATPDTTWQNDTWLYRGGRWTAGPTAPEGLTPRGGSAMAYDPDIGKLVLFGGEARAADGSEMWPPYTNETWLWDGATWSRGPDAPLELAGRTGAAMVYDDALHRVVLFGGSGLLRYTDTWLFDGSQWTRGPDAPAGMAPRVFFGMAYDQLAGKVVVGGGDGGTDVWLFDGSQWTAGPSFPDSMINRQRERTRMAFDAQLRAVLLFGGLGPGSPVEEIYYLRTSDPGATWTQIPEALPSPGPFSPPPGRLDGAVVWVPTLGAMMFFAGFRAAGGGQLGFTDAWFFRDVPPELDSVSIGPDPPFQTQGLDAVLGTVSGGYMKTRVAIRWAVNGKAVPDAIGKHLDPQYRSGDVVQAQVQLTDVLGVVGPWVSSNTVTVTGATLLASDGLPGGQIQVRGLGFGANESVEIRLGSPTGTILGTATADQWGRFIDVPVVLPNPTAGGINSAFGLGQTTGTVSAAATLTIHPGGAALDPFSLAAGQSTTFSASGFLPGEEVKIAFPDGDRITAVADELGAVAVGLISPAEPAPGGDVGAVAPSGWTEAHYTTIAAVLVTGTPAPGSIPVSLSGFASREWVVIQLDGTSASAVFTDAAGSGQTTLTGPAGFGSHTVDVVGWRSGVTATTTVDLAATMIVEPASGPPGTVVTLDSGPGWLPGWTVDFYVDRKLVASFTADDTGVVQGTVTVAEHPPGLVELVLRDDVIGEQARAKFRVTR